MPQEPATTETLTKKVPLTPEEAKQQQFERNTKLFNVLHEKYPHCFIDFVNRKINKSLPHPLAIGVHKAIKAENSDIPTHHLSNLLGIYTANHRYLKAIKAGAPRVDLQGNPTGDTVTEAHEKDAQTKLIRLKAKRKAQKAAKKEQAHITATAETPNQAPTTTDNHQKQIASKATSKDGVPAKNNLAPKQEESIIDEKTKSLHALQGRTTLSLKKKTNPLEKESA